MRSLIGQVVVEVEVGWRAYLALVGELLLAAGVGLAAYLVVWWVARRVVRRTRVGLDDLLLAHLARPARFAFPLLFMLFARSRERTRLPEAPFVDHGIQILLIAAIAWVVLAVVNAVAEYVKVRHDIAVPDNREARRVHTQVTVVGHTLRTVVVVAGLAAVLMTFPGVSQVGASLLASAGIAGIAVGIAARPVLENIIAGLQLGVTQPVRLDDVVIVDGEWGRVEEITLTYVVVKIWDERRLIVPFSKFISESFQNWSRTNTQLLGTAFVWVDYRADIGRLREAARQIVEASPLWDKRAFAVQVTDTTERSVQVRVLVSASNAGSAFDLRVYVREELIGWLQREMPEALPVDRVEVKGEMVSTKGRGDGAVDGGGRSA